MSDAASELRVETQLGRVSVLRAGSTTPILVQNAEADHRPFIHPIMSPGGAGVITENAPSHHLWQHGLYIGLNDVNGVGFWMEGLRESAAATDGTFHPRIAAPPEASGTRMWAEKPAAARLGRSGRGASSGTWATMRLLASSQVNPTQKRCRPCCTSGVAAKASALSPPGARRAANRASKAVSVSMRPLTCARSESASEMRSVRWSSRSFCSAARSQASTAPTNTSEISSGSAHSPRRSAGRGGSASAGRGGGRAGEGGADMRRSLG